MPRLLILNKWDQLEAPARAELADAFPHALPVAAKTGEGCKPLLEQLEMRLLHQATNIMTEISPSLN